MSVVHFCRPEKGNHPVNMASSPCVTRLSGDIVLFGTLPPVMERLLGQNSDPPAESVLDHDCSITSQMLHQSPTALVMIPFPSTVDYLSRYHRTLVAGVFSVIKQKTWKRIIHLSRLGAHRPDKTGPILGCYEMERYLNWLREPSLLHLRCGFFPDEVIEHLFLVPGERSMMSLLSPTTPIPVSQPHLISRYVLSEQKASAKPGQFIAQPEPLFFFTIEKMLKYLNDTTGELVNYRQLAPETAMSLYCERGYGRGAARSWCELFGYLNMDHGLLHDAANVSGRQCTSFAELFGKILSRVWMKGE